MTHNVDGTGFIQTCTASALTHHCVEKLVVVHAEHAPIHLMGGQAQH